MKSIVAGIATEYEIDGHGPVVLMLHGWGDSLHAFDLLAAKLQGYQIVRLDLPGFGQSELPRGTWGVGDYARFVKEFCDKHHISPKYVVGHSFGGRILIKSLANELFSPIKLVLIGSAGVADREVVQNTVFMYIAKIGKIILKAFPNNWYLRLRRELYRVIGGDYVSVGALKETFIKVIQEDLSKDAQRIRIPTLLVWGEDDFVTPLAEGRKLNRLIQDSQLETFRQAGHFVHQQKASDVAALIRHFFV